MSREAGALPHIAGSRFAVECVDVVGLILLARETGSESAAFKRNVGHR